MNIVFLCSGGGGNLRFIHAVGRRTNPVELKITGVFGDRPGPALEFADRHGIPCGSARFDGSDDDEICASIEKCAPDVIVTNIHRILSPRIVATYRGRLLNLHYSLLPLFGGLMGMEPVRRAVDSGCCFVGTTVHHVIEAVDAGPIVSQTIVPVVSGESFDTLADRVFRSGCMNLLNGIRLLDGSDPDSTSRMADSPPIPSATPTGNFEPDEDFWTGVRG